MGKQHDDAATAHERRFPMSYDDFLAWAGEGIHLTEAGKYLAVLPDSAGHYHSAVLSDFWFDPAWFWATPTPDPLLLLAEIAPDSLAPVLAARGQGE